MSFVEEAMSQPDTNSECLVTIVVTQRERFGLARRSLKSLIETADVPFELIYVDGRAPRRERKFLEEATRRDGWRLIRRECYLPPNVARNLAIEQVRTKYIAFVDNDVLFEPGWLSALIDCAEDTGAALVSPVTCIGDPERPGPQKIHFAGGTITVSERAGGKYFESRHNYESELLEEARHRMAREECDCVEFHCVLARRDLFDRAGPLDEDLRGSAEQYDVSLTAREHGGKVFFEPKAIVTYVVGPPLAWSELPYFCVRWSDAWAVHARIMFHRKWQFDGNMSGIRFIRSHRLDGFWSLTRRLETVIGWRLSRWTSRLLFRLFEGVGLRRALAGTQQYERLDDVHDVNPAEGPPPELERRAPAQ